jgi:hypothetical protein
MLKKLLLRLGLSLLGVAVMLSWWTWGPKQKQTHAEQSHIPAKILAGGESLEIDADTTTAATMRVSFDDLDRPIGQQAILNSFEKIPAGSRSWTIDVPAGVGGLIELEADHPNPGDTLTMRVHMNENLVDEQSETLDQPLEPDTAFFVQKDFDDYSKATLQLQP